MKIKLNKIFSNPRGTHHVPAYDKYEYWSVLTKGRHDRSINTAKGIEFYQSVNNRVPALFFHTNPFKEETENTPWRDIIIQERGYVLYNGDNKDSTKKAHEPRGNKKITELLPLYFSQKREDRMKAPPIIISRTVKINNLSGFREFIGYGVITKPPRLVHQYEKNSNNIFSNYQFEITLISLYPEESFDWKWIDDRRDSSYSDTESLTNAPENWKKWVNEGKSCIQKIIFQANPPYTKSENEQKNMPNRNKIILNDLLNKHYPYSGRQRQNNALRFESMAAFITELYFKECGYDYSSGWITRGSGDRGVDFVGRLDIGNDDFSKSNIIVLGQSKRYTRPISGERLTRVASRMTRGYMGVVVTLDTFTEPGQREVKDDKLPIIMINGKKASQLLLNYLNQENIKLKDLVRNRDDWMENNLRDDHYDSILTNI